MLIGIDNVINWLDTNKTPYWKVKDGTGEKSGLIFSARPDDDTPIALEDSKQKLRQCLDTLAPGNYAIQAWTTPGQKKEWNTIKFQITNASGQVPYQNNQSIGGFQGQTQDVQKMIEDALNKERTTNKIERLEADVIAKDKRIKELEAELNSTEMRIGDRFDKVFGGFGIDMNPKTAQNKVGNIEDDTERVGQLMERWHNSDSDFETVLNGIVTLAETNPGKYQMGKNLLR